MSNSFELLQGPIADIQRKYEILSGIGIMITKIWNNYALGLKYICNLLVVIGVCCGNDR